MRTDDLIQSLGRELRPVSRHAVPARIAAGITAGSLIAASLLLLLIGIRPDLTDAMGSAAFWSKILYNLATATTAVWIVAKLARPDAGVRDLRILILPLIAFLPVAALELARTDQAQWLPMLLGHGWRRCTWLVLGLSLPIYAGLWWAFRQFAPACLEMTGLAAGVCSGAFAAIVYCLHCPTDTAVFALAWYTLAFALAGALGALIGPRFLRW